MKSLLVAWVGAVCSGHSFADVITVGPAGDFTEIQAAVTAAAPGDSILVEAGEYGPFEIDKPLRVLGAGRDLVLVNGTNTSEGFVAMDIRDIPLGQEVVVSGMSFAIATEASVWPLIHVHDNAGAVVLHDIETPATFQAAKPGPTVYLVASDWVMIEQSVIRGGGSFFFDDPSEAIFAIDSELWIYSSDVRGMGVDLGAQAQPSVALFAVDSLVYSADTTMKGGDGGIVQLGFSVACVTGAQAAVFQGDGLAKFVNGEFITGQTGFHVACATDPPPPNLGTIELLGTTLGIFSNEAEIDAPGIFTGTGASASVNSLNYPTLALDPVRAAPGDSIDLHAAGAPGGAGLAFYSLGLGSDEFFLPGIDGVFALDPVPLLGSLPVDLDGAGEQLIPLAIPTAPALLGIVVHLQWLQIDASLNGMSNPTLLPIR